MDENSPCLHKDARCTNKETISKYQKNGSDRVGISTIAAIRFPPQCSTASIVHWLTYCIGMLLLSARVFS